MKKSELFALLVVMLFAALLQAQTQSAPAAPGLRADWAQQFDDVTKKVLSLAEAVPAEKYSWRPAEGVRSVSEVYVHIAGGNYFSPRLPASIRPRDSRGTRRKQSPTKRRSLK